MRDRRLLERRLFAFASLVLLAGGLAASGIASPADGRTADKASPRLMSGLAPSTALDENFDEIKAASKRGREDRKATAGAEA